MSYAARVVQASVPSFGGPTLYTVEVRFPRFILAEYNTHRDFARNSASSRAIPPEKHIENLHQNGPFIPEVFRKRVKGMGAGRGAGGPGRSETDLDQRFRSRHRPRRSLVRDGNLQVARQSPAGAVLVAHGARHQH